MKLLLPIFLLLFSGQYLHAQNNIHDADNNTKVTTEAVANEDRIRFYLGGTQKWSISPLGQWVPSNSNRNIRIGYNTGNSLTTGADNVFMGYRAGQGTTSGGNLVGIGKYTLQDNTTGYSNIALGTSTLTNNTTGYANMGIGTSSLFNNTTGRNNTAVGVSALSLNVSGLQNIGIGTSSLYKTTASSNVGIGYQAGFNNTSGNNNIMIGNKAGFSNVTGVHNTYIGGTVGYLSTGSNNVFIGYQAGYNETASDRLYIANSSTATPLIFGNFASNVVGFGTTNPTDRVQIKSDAGQDALRVQVNGSTNLRIFANNSTSIGSNNAGDANQLRVTYGSSKFNNNIGVGTAPDESMVKVMGEVGNTSPVLYSEVSNTGTQTKAIQGKALAAPGKGYGGYFEGGYMSVYGRTSGGVAPNTSYGGYFYNANTGNQSKYGLYTRVNSVTGTGTHYGLYASVSGAGNKYAGYFTGGKVIVNSVSAPGGGNLVLNETTLHDYTRITMKDGSGTDYWDIATKADGANSVMNFYYNDGAGGTNVLALDGDMKYAGVNGSPNYTFDVHHGTGTPTATGGNGLNVENTSTGENWTMYTFSTGDFKLYRNGAVKGTFNKTSGVYTPVSDRSLKKDISAINGQLAKIMKLKPSTYLFKDQKGVTKNYGFIAQEVKAIFPELAPVVSTVREGGKDLLGVSYTEFIPILVAGIQEQQSVIEQQNDKIAILESKLDKIENLDAKLAKIAALDAKLAKLDEMSERLDQFSTDLQYCCSKSTGSTTIPVKMNKTSELPFVEQNIPNPFTAQTEIKYYIPRSAQGGMMQITDRSGQVLKTVRINEVGAGKVTLDANELAAGSYFYTFMVDGKVIDTKQMVLTK